MTEFTEAQLMRVLADEARAPEVDTSLELQLGEAFEQGPLRIVCDQVGSFHQPPRPTIRFELEGHDDFDALNHVGQLDLRLRHWGRFRAYSVHIQGVGADEEGAVQLRVAKRPSEVVELAYGKLQTLALHQLGRFPDGKTVLVRQCGGYQVWLRLEVPGESSYHEDRQLWIGAGDFRRRRGLRFYDVRYNDDPVHPAVQLRVVPETAQEHPFRPVAFDQPLRFTLDERLQFPDGLQLAASHIGRHSMRDWEVELVLRRGASRRDVVLRPREQERVEVQGDYAVKLKSMHLKHEGPLPVIEAMVRKRAAAPFELGQEFSLAERETRESASGVRLCFMGLGHAHGSIGIDEDGNEIPYTRGWYDLQLSWQGREGMLQFDRSDDARGFPVVEKWRDLTVQIIADHNDSIVVRVDRRDRQGKRGLWEKPDSDDLLADIDEMPDLDDLDETPDLDDIDETPDLDDPDEDDGLVEDDLENIELE